MTRFYHIARLIKNKHVFFEGSTLRIQFDEIKPADYIYNDEALLAQLHPDHYFYVSGGGTFFVNQRYLLVVRRDSQAHINSGMLSLFTGRAEGPEEWAQPWRVQRELFEELTLLEKGQPLRFSYPPLQTLIDARHSVAQRKSILLALIDIANCELAVYDGHTKLYESSVCLSLTKCQDINLLYAFAITLDIDSIIAKDNEDGKQRSVMALDTQRWQLIDLTIAPDYRRPVPVTPEIFSENLQTILRALGLV